jgi:hypothetical protein
VTSNCKKVFCRLCAESGDDALPEDEDDDEDDVPFIWSSSVCGTIPPEPPDVLEVAVVTKALLRFRWRVS